MFYHLSCNASNRYRYSQMDYDYYSTHEEVCSTCGRTVRNNKLAYWPPKIWLEGGKRYPDCLQEAIIFDEKCGMIVSERALAAFEKEEISGYEAAPIEISDCKKAADGAAEMPNYFYLYIKGSIALDYKAMHYRKKNVCPDCGSFRWSREKIGQSAIDYSTWNQCDICKLVDYPNLFLCTQKVIDVIKAYKLKGFTMRGETEIFLPLKAVKVC